MLGKGRASKELLITDWSGLENVLYHTLSSSMQAFLQLSFQVKSPRKFVFCSKQAYELSARVRFVFFTHVFGLSLNSAFIPY